MTLHGRRDTERLDLTLRSNVTVAEGLSVEFFGQLFGARGRYRDFRPGAGLFVVWSQDRRLRRDDPFLRDRQGASPCDRPTGRRLTDAFRAVPRNAFIVKLQHTLR